MIKTMKLKYSLCAIVYTSWSGLGYIRGIHSYKYNHNKYETEKKEDYLYVSSLVYGFFGICIYANPVLLPFTIYKEIYRFEVDVRNLEDEKKTSFYNSLLY